MKIIGHHLYWDILESLPPGWIVDSRTGSPKHKHVFITNGKHPFEDGFDRALLHIDCITPAKRLQGDIEEPITADEQMPTDELPKKRQ